MNARFRQLIALAIACWLALPPGWCCVLLGAEWTRLDADRATPAEVENVPACCRVAHNSAPCHDDASGSRPASSGEAPIESCLCMAAADEPAVPPASVEIPEAPVGFVFLLPPPSSCDPVGLTWRDESTRPLPALAASSRQALLCVWRC
ncbi:MAG TPA: hypothetical protein VGE52_15745 [Pirellulales bacterium]